MNNYVVGPIGPSVFEVPTHPFRVPLTKETLSQWYLSQVNHNKSALSVMWYDHTNKIQPLTYEVKRHEH